MRGEAKERKSRNSKEKRVPGQRIGREWKRGREEAVKEEDLVSILT